MNDNDSEIIKVLLNKRMLKAVLKDLEIEQVQSISDKLSEVLKEMVEDFEIRKREQERHQERLRAIAQMIKEDGLRVEEVISALQGSDIFPTKKAKRKPKEPKYQYSDSEGNVRTWTGQGKTPKAIQIKLDEGADLSDFLITKN